MSKILFELNLITKDSTKFIFKFYRKTHYGQDRPMSIWYTTRIKIKIKEKIYKYTIPCLLHDWKPYYDWLRPDSKFAGCKKCKKIKKLS